MRTARLRTMLFAGLAMAAPLGSLDHAYAQSSSPSTLVARNPPGQPRSRGELEARARAERAPAAADTLTPQVGAAAAAQAKADRVRRFEANADALLRKRMLSPAKHAQALAVVLEAMRAREEALALLVAGATVDELMARAQAGDEALKALLIKAHPARVAHELIRIMGEQAYAQYQQDRRAAQ